MGVMYQCRLLSFEIEYEKELHAAIDPANLPTWLGGTCECPGGCVRETVSKHSFTVETTVFLAK